MAIFARCLPLLLLAVASVVGHGCIIEPPRRPGGGGRVEACGSAIQEADKAVGGTLRISELRNLPHDPARCNVELCKGTQFSDAVSRGTIQHYKAGQTFDMKVDIRATHPGRADVSIVDTSTGQRIGEPLKKWDSGYGAAIEVQTFSLTMPHGLEQCSEAGRCVVSWYWSGVDLSNQAFYEEQQYNSCVDFSWSP